MTRKSVLCAALCLLLCALLALSMAYIAFAAEHDCPGDACLICVEMQSRLSSVKRMLFVLAIGAPTLGAFLRALPSSRDSSHFFVHATPVSLKVKMIN